MRDVLDGVGLMVARTMLYTMQDGLVEPVVGMTFPSVEEADRYSRMLEAKGLRADVHRAERPFILLIGRDAGTFLAPHLKDPCDPIWFHPEAQDVWNWFKYPEGRWE